MPSLDGIESEAEFIDVDKFRRDIDSKFIKPLSQALAGAFPVDIGAIKMMSKRIPPSGELRSRSKLRAWLCFWLRPRQVLYRRRDSN